MAGTTREPLALKELESNPKAAADVARTPLIFKLFKREELRSALRDSRPPKASTTIRLPINPHTLGFQQARLVERQRVERSGRFIILDWGPDLLTLDAEGQTGNLLTLTSGVIPRALLQSKVELATGTPVKDLSQVSSLELIRKLPYFDVLALNDRWNAFQRLQQLYRSFDADLHILALEYGPFYYRGYFENFSFSQTAESPWNWQYSFTFIVLLDLSKANAQTGLDVSNQASGYPDSAQIIEDAAIDQQNIPSTFEATTQADAGPTPPSGPVVEPS